MSLQRVAPTLAVEIHQLRRHRLIGRRAELLGFQRFHARAVVFLDQLEAPPHGFVRPMVERDRRPRDVVDQRIELVVEQRQPVLLPWIAITRANCLVERIRRGRAAEQRDITPAEQRRRLLAECHLAHRHQGQLLHRLLRALAHRIERLDALQRVAEEIEPYRRRPSRREYVENSAAHRELARLHNRAGPRETIERQAFDELPHVDALSGRHRLQGLADETLWRQPLQDGVDRRQYDRRLLARAEYQPRQRRDALCHDVRIGADAVVRHRIPSRE